MASYSHAARRSETGLGPLKLLLRIKLWKTEYLFTNSSCCEKTLRFVRIPCLIRAKTESFSKTIICENSYHIRYSSRKEQEFGTRIAGTEVLENKVPTMWQSE